MAAGCLDDGFNLAAGIHLMDTHARFAIFNGHQTGFDRIRPDACQHIPAGRSVIDRRVIDGYLGEKIIDIAVFALGRRNNAGFTGDRRCATNPVNLARVGRAECRQQNTVPQ